MPGLGQTVSELMMKRMRDAAAWAPTNAAANAAASSGGTSVLQTVTPAGRNPGHLRMLTFVPPGLPPGTPLVVVLHGCTQTAAGYDAGSGWSELARRHGFALLYPEQQSSNNPNTCFNWFVPEDVTRGHGEVASIAEMIAQMLAEHRLDPARVYVTGLSAGGAMASAMLATYPELFAGGAVIAGLPFGAAENVGAALEAMRHVRTRPAAEWGDNVRQASGHRGARPAVQIWHGDADSTVRRFALEESAKQWCDVAAISAPPRCDEVNGTAHCAWQAADGHVAVETYLVPGLGHGVPLHSQSTDLDESVGLPAPYMLEAGIGSTRRIAQSWGLLTQAPRPRSTRRPPAGKPQLAGAADVSGFIKGALRRAGLGS